MLHRGNELQGYTIAATDGDLGKVQDLYFDDQKWAVRYLVVDTGGWLSGRLVLVSPHVVTSADDAAKHVLVSLTQAQVKDSPGIETDMPFDRQQEIAYRNYFGWPPYWGGVGALSQVAVQPVVGVADRDVPAEGDHHLRSASVVGGYHIAASDGDIGHVDDFIIDDASWAIRYLVVDTRNWLPGKKVLLSPQWVSSVEWPAADVVVRLTREQIAGAPAYDHDAPITREYETELHKHYGEGAYWQ